MCKQILVKKPTRDSMGKLVTNPLDANADGRTLTDNEDIKHRRFRHCMNTNTKRGKTAAFKDFVEYLKYRAGEILQRPKPTDMVKFGQVMSKLNNETLAQTVSPVYKVAIQEYSDTYIKAKEAFMQRPCTVDTDDLIQWLLKKEGYKHQPVKGSTKTYCNYLSNWKCNRYCPESVIKVFEMFFNSDTVQKEPDFSIKNPGRQEIDLTDFGSWLLAKHGLAHDPIIGNSAKYSNYYCQWKRNSGKVGKKLVQAIKLFKHTYPEAKEIEKLTKVQIKQTEIKNEELTIPVTPVTQSDSTTKGSTDYMDALQHVVGASPYMPLITKSDIPNAKVLKSSTDLTVSQLIAQLKACGIKEVTFKI